MAVEIPSLDSYGLQASQGPLHKTFIPSLLVNWKKEIWGRKISLIQKL